MTRLDWVATVGAILAVASSCGNNLGRNAATVANKQAPAETGATSPAPTAKQIAKAAADARHAISETRKLNYDAPRRNLRIEQQSAAMSLSLKACRLGDTASCWRGANIVRLQQTRSPVRAELTIEIRSNCLAGDDLSCRALLSWVGSTEDTMIDRADCERGVATACYEVAIIPANAGATDTKVRLLQRGCSLGHAESCRKLEEVLIDEAGRPMEEGDRATALQIKLQNEQCARGWPSSCWGLYADAPQYRSKEQIMLMAEKGCLEEMPGDCMALVFGGTREQLISWGRTCPLRGFGCQHLAKLQSDPIGVRDALEHGCQFRNDDLCLDLVKRYRAGKLPEPVPGRAADLASYLCTTKFAAEVCPGTSKQ